jgi:hypothetical protein
VGDESYGSRFQKYKEEKLEEFTDEPAKFLTTNDFVGAAVEGNYEKVKRWPCVCVCVILAVI